MPRILRAAIVALAGLFLPAGCGPSAEDPRPDIVLVSIDTLRADGLGCGGNPRGPSPHLDRLARGSATFAACIAQASATLPSHRSLLQSLPASRTSDASPTLAEVFRDAGWATVAWTGGGNLSRELGFDRGFETWEESGEGLAWSAARFAEWLDAGGGGGRPYLAFLHGYDVHVPYHPPAPLVRLYDPDYDGRITPEETRPLCRAIRRLGRWEEYTGSTDLDARDRTHLRALYDAAVRAADRRVGRMLRSLEERDPDGRAIVAIVSDHGEEFFEHGSVLHSHTVFQELVHVPLILHAPGTGRAGVVHGGVVRNLDVAPTLVDLAGLPPVPDHFGDTLRGILQGGAEPGRPATSEMARWKSLLRWPWKVVAEGNRAALFDLATDPGETTDLAASHPDTTTALLTELRKLVSGAAVDELDLQAGTEEQRARLRALGYVD